MLIPEQIEHRVQMDQRRAAHVRREKSSPYQAREEQPMLGERRLYADTRANRAQGPNGPEKSSPCQAREEQPISGERRAAHVRREKVVC